MVVGHRTTPAGFECRALPQESLGELLQSVVTLRAGTLQDPLHVLPEPGLTPVVAGGHLGAAGIAFACRLEQRQGGCGIEVGIVGRRQVEAAGRIAPAVTLLLRECS